MFPLLHLLMRRPELLSEHALAYGELTVCEISDLAANARGWILWSAAALGSAIAAMVLAGVSLMLAFTLPGTNGAAQWALILTPCLPLLGTVACVLNLRAYQRKPAFAELREQLGSDLQLLREVTAP